MQFLKLVHDIAHMQFKPGNDQSKTYISVCIFEEKKIALKLDWGGLRPNATEVKR